MRPSTYFIFTVFLLGTAGLPMQAQQAASAETWLTEIPSPCQRGGESNLFVDDRGIAWLSWVEFIDDTTDALFCTWLEGNSWVPAREIARGNNWFVNWADFPSLAVFPGSAGKQLAAHWLQKSAAGTFDYDVRMRISSSKGADWGPSFVVHQDHVAAEHGFVTLIPADTGQIRAVWLDGRHTKDEGHAADAGHDEHHGAMSLRTALIDPMGIVYSDTELDHKVCDCCQTDAAIGLSGPIVVYRNRSDEEIRDIYVVRQEKGTWSTPYPLHQDSWLIAGCPVNGPAISTRGGQAAVAWFTGAGGKSKVQVTFSKDDGKTFGKPIRIDDGNPVGRVDIEWIDSRTVAVSWLEKTDATAMIRIRILGQGSKRGRVLDIMPTREARTSGFPVLARDAHGLLLSATQVDAEGHTTVRTFRIRLD